MFTVQAANLSRTFVYGKIKKVSKDGLQVVVEPEEGIESIIPKNLNLGQNEKLGNTTGKLAKTSIDPLRRMKIIQNILWLRKNGGFVIHLKKSLLLESSFRRPKLKPNSWILALVFRKKDKYLAYKIYEFASRQDLLKSYLAMKFDLNRMIAKKQYFLIQQVTTKEVKKRKAKKKFNKKK